MKHLFAVIAVILFALGIIYSNGTPMLFGCCAALIAIVEDMLTTKRDE